VQDGGGTLTEGLRRRLGDLGADLIAAGGDRRA